MDETERNEMISHDDTNAIDVKNLKIENIISLAPEADGEQSQANSCNLHDVLESINLEACIAGKDFDLKRSIGAVVSNSQSADLYWCNSCQFTTGSKAVLSQHLEDNHLFVCEHCAYRTFSRYERICHMKSTHEQAMGELADIQLVVLNGQLSVETRSSAAAGSEKNTILPRQNSAVNYPTDSTVDPNLHQQHSKKDTDKEEEVHNVHIGTDVDMAEKEALDSQSSIGKEADEIAETKPFIRSRRTRIKRQPTYTYIPIPIKYGCKMCRYSHSDPLKVKVHISSRHKSTSPGSIQATDLRQRHLRKMSKVFFCVDKSCDFYIIGKNEECLLPHYYNTDHFTAIHLSTFKTNKLRMNSKDVLPENDSETNNQTSEETLVPELVLLENIKKEVDDDLTPIKIDSLNDKVFEVIANGSETPVPRLKKEKALHDKILKPVKIKASTSNKDKSNGLKKGSIKKHKPVFKCKNCDFSTYFRKVLKNHTLKMHRATKGKKRRLEEEQKKVYRHKKRSIALVRRHAFQYMCRYCSIESDDTSKLKDHIVIDHKDNTVIIVDRDAEHKRQRKFIYYCRQSDCNYSTRKPLDYTSHKDNSHGTSCDPQEHSKVSVPRKRQHSMDEWIEDGKTPKKVTIYKCTHCDYKKEDLRTVKGHMLTEHRGFELIVHKTHADNTNPISTYLCPRLECSFTSRKQSSLESHFLVSPEHFNIELPSEDVKNVSADYIGTTGMSILAAAAERCSPVESSSPKKRKSLHCTETLKGQKQTIDKKPDKKSKVISRVHDTKLMPSKFQTVSLLNSPIVSDVKSNKATPSNKNKIVIIAPGALHPSSSFTKASKPPAGYLLVAKSTPPASEVRVNDPVPLKKNAKESTKTILVANIKDIQDIKESRDGKGKTTKIALMSASQNVLKKTQGFTAEHAYSKERKEKPARRVSVEETRKDTEGKRIKETVVDHAYSKTENNMQNCKMQYQRHWKEGMRTETKSKQVSSPVSADNQSGDTNALGYRCSVCNCRNDSYTSVRDHMVKEHRQKPIVIIDAKAQLEKRAFRMMMCPNKDCSFAAYNHTDFLYHLNTQNHNLNTSKSIADTHPSVNRSLRERVETSPKIDSVNKNAVPSNKLYQCSYCACILTSITAMQEHFNTKHDADSPVYLEVNTG